MSCAVLSYIEQEPQHGHLTRPCTNFTGLDVVRAGAVKNGFQVADPKRAIVDCCGYDVMVAHEKGSEWRQASVCFASCRVPRFRQCLAPDNGRWMLVKWHQALGLHGCWELVWPGTCVSGRAGKTCCLIRCGVRSRQIEGFWSERLSEWWCQLLKRWKSQGGLSWGVSFSELLLAWGALRHAASWNANQDVVLEVRAQETSGIGAYIWDSSEYSWHLKLGDSGLLQGKGDSGWTFRGRAQEEELGTEDGTKDDQVCPLRPLGMTPTPWLGWSQRLSGEKRSEASSVEMLLPCHHVHLKQRPLAEHRLKEDL